MRRDVGATDQTKVDGAKARMVCRGRPWFGRRVAMETSASPTVMMMIMMVVVVVVGVRMAGISGGVGVPMHASLHLFVL